MTRAERILALKVAIVFAGGTWRAIMIPSWVEVMFGVTPYLMLVFAWEYLRRPWLIALVAATIAWSDVSACVAARRALATSSMAGVALIMQFLFASCVMASALVFTFFVPPRRRR